MGQDKKQLAKLLRFIKEIYDDPDNKEFAAGIQALALADSKEDRNERFDEIYEYCIERNSRKQADAIYRNFPIKELANELADDYFLMESFKRRGDFLNFSAHLFKQIEGIANYICKVGDYGIAFKNLCRTPSYILYNQDTPMSIFSRNSNSIPVCKLLFGDYDKTIEGKDKCDVPLSRQYIIDKIKIALYFGGYATCIFSSTEFTKFSYDISNVYQIRCEADHRGNERSDKQEKAFQNIMRNQDGFYSEFLKLLHFYIDKISEGYSRRQEVFDYASNLLVENFNGIVTSVLPSALYIKCEGQELELVPSSAYSRSVKYENGMQIVISKKGGTIISIKPLA